MPSSVDPAVNSPQRWEVWSILLLVIVVALGVYIRSESMLTWPEKRNILFAGEEPVLIGLDGYYYLNIAKELGENSYGTFEPKRGYPEGVTRRPHPSLLPVLLHQASQLSGLSLNWIGIWLPVVLGMTLLIPIYLFARYFGSTHGAVAAVAVAALAPFFVGKSHLSFLDTDSLNLVLPLICTYLFMRFGLATSSKRYFYLLAGIFFYLLFLWWWDMSPAAATALGLSPLGIALVFHYRPPLKEALLFGLVVVACFVVLSWQADLIPRVITLSKAAWGQFSYISKDAGLFANIGESIQEQQKTSFPNAMAMNIANLGCLALAMVGLCLLIVKEKSKILYLLPMALLGTFSFFYAIRFTFFLTPLLAIGFGSFFTFVYPLIGRKYLYYGCYGLAIASLAWVGIGLVRNVNPIFRGEIITGMVRLQEHTPPDALVWSWWDEGHPLVYWAGRATVSDGMIHGGSISYYTALPMVSDDFRFAANFMQFYAVRGRPGIDAFIEALDVSYAKGMAHLKNILSLGPHNGENYLANLVFSSSDLADHLQFQNIDYYYPSTAPPIYLFLNSRMFGTMPWIYWYGTWDTERKSGTPTLPSLHLRPINYNENNMPQHVGVMLNTVSGWITVAERLQEKSPIHSITILGQQPTPFRTYDNFPSAAGHRYHFPENTQIIIDAQPRHTDTGMYSVRLHPEKQELVVEDQKIAASVMHTLFTHKRGDPGQHFSPIDVTEEHYQIWQVQGEQR
jgi:hypothetical protein